jgi:hypothetical protein
MGINCSAKLSNKATWEYVGMVASVLLGAKATKQKLGADSFHAVVEGFNRNTWKPTSMPEYIYILVNGFVDNPVAKAIQDTDELPYHMWYGLEQRSLYPKATAEKIALTLALVKFFGGEITYNDASCDGPETFPVPKYIGAQGGKEWQRLHQEILDLKPLTQADIDACKKWAAY